MSSFLEYVQDRLKVCGPLTFKNMFGGYGVYSGPQIFAMVIKDNLYFRVGPSNQSEYETAGMSPFTYAGKDGKLVRISYWQVPEEILEDNEDLRFWFQKALAEARKSSTLKKKVPKKKTLLSKSKTRIASKRSAPKKKAAKKKTTRPALKKKAVAKKKTPAKKKRKR